MGSKKTMLSSFITGALALFILEGAVAETLRFAEFGPNRGARAEALEWFADELEKRSDGTLTIEFHWGKSLLGTKEVLKGVGDGVADMGSIIGAFSAKELRLYNIGDLPVENSDEWVGMRAMYETATQEEALTKQFADQGVVYVTNYTTGPIQLICTEPLTSLDQLENVKLRGTGPYAKTFAALGATVQRMPQTEVYQALDTGLIDCNQNYYYSMRAYKQYEVASHVTELDWGQNMAFGIVMNKATFDGLSDSQKTALRETGSAFIDHFAEVMIGKKESDREDMVAGIDGDAIEIVELPEDERAKLIEAGKKQVGVWKKAAAEEGLPAEAFLGRYLDRVNAHASQKEEEGYPWQ